MNELAVSPEFFFIFAGASIFLALNVVLRRNPISSAFSLVLMFFCFAAIYALLQAHLVAALQVLVYAGAVMVLFIFVIMLLNSDTPSIDFFTTPLALRALIAIAIGVLTCITVLVIRASTQVLEPGLYTADNVEAAGGNTQVLSELLFSEYILPFELTSVLLLGAIVGSVAMAKRKRYSRRGV